MVALAFEAWCLKKMQGSIEGTSFAPRRMIYSLSVIKKEIKIPVFSLVDMQVSFLKVTL